MVIDKDDSLRAPSEIEQFVRLLVVVNKAVTMYPATSEIPVNAADACVKVLRGILLDVPDVRLMVSRYGVAYNGAPVFPGTKAFADFAHELYVRRLSEVRFHAGIEARDIISFLTVLTHSPEEVDAAGGFEARLWELGVGTITVSEIKVTLIEKPGLPLLPQSGEFGPIDMAAIDDALSAAVAGCSYDEVLLARLVNDPVATCEYLGSVYAAHADRAALVAVGERFTALADVGSGLSPGREQDIYHALAEAILGLDPGLQDELVSQELLPESRTSPALEGVVRQMGFDNICRFFAARRAENKIDKDRLVRVIRGIVLISASDREEVIAMAGAVMLEAGLCESDIAEILELATPTHLTVRPGAPVARARPAETLFSLLDLSSIPQRPRPGDGQLGALRAEAARGITDGDIVAAMVSLVGCDVRPTKFAATMTMLEDALGNLIETGSVDVAADAAISLRESAKNPALSTEQRVRVEHAVDIFAQPSDMRALARTIRVYPKDSPESLAAQRLINVLGAPALRPLLENLADEPDMAIRKSLVDILSKIAKDYIPELGTYVGDSRWYFARNVVAILASTKSSAALMYLERTLRHHDVRVRRETIRALSGINDQLATEMLVAALHDEDGQNVQLAARYLGQRGTRGAIPALEQVARGEGTGNRDIGPRVEAIEALGRLGAKDALPTLESLAGKRSLLARGRGRELRAAADAAIQTIRARGAVQ